eukprot:scaffold175540_cov20-Tisochrysis_lutea.AAC.4
MGWRGMERTNDLFMLAVQSGAKAPAWLMRINARAARYKPAAGIPGGAVGASNSLMLAGLLALQEILLDIRTDTQTNGTHKHRQVVALHQMAHTLTGSCSTTQCPAVLDHLDGMHFLAKPSKRGDIRRGWPQGASPVACTFHTNVHPWPLWLAHSTSDSGIKKTSITQVFRKPARVWKAPRYTAQILSAKPKNV